MKHGSIPLERTSVNKNNINNIIEEEKLRSL
jgi:hypothetical protein